MLICKEFYAKITIFANKSAIYTNTQLKVILSIVNKKFFAPLVKTEKNASRIFICKFSIDTNAFIW